MSIASRKLGIGARVVTDFAGGPLVVARMTFHTITDIDRRAGCQSGIMFKVTPDVPKSSGGWIDADWFEEVK